MLQRRNQRLREATRLTRTIRLVTGKARSHPVSEGLRSLRSAPTAGRGLLSRSHCPQIKQRSGGEGSSQAGEGWGRPAIGFLQSLTPSPEGDPEVKEQLSFQRCFENENSRKMGKIT